MGFCFCHSPHHLIMEQTRTAEHNKILIDPILVNSSEKVIQSGVIGKGIT